MTYKNIFQSYIPMNDAVGMEIDQGESQLVHDLNSVWFTEHFTMLNAVVEVTTL